jgi:DedD protein
MPDPRDPQLDELRRRARRRLVGAVVLALAAAVLVPMLLESDPKPLGEDVSVKIPPVDDSRFVNKVGEKAKVDAPASKDAPKDGPATPPKSVASAEQRVLAPPSAKPAATAKPGDAAPPVPDMSAKPAEPAADAAPAPKAEPKPVEPVKPLEQPKAAEATKAPEPARAPAPAKAGDTGKAAEPAKATEPAKAGSYSVQLAAFIDDKGANALAGRLKKSGYSAYTEPYSTSRGTLWRVRVGPFASRDAAESARAKLKGEGQNGIITAAK